MYQRYSGAIVSAAMMIGVLAGAAAPALAEGAVTCAGKRATIVGTDADEVLRGTARADVIVGLGGKDTIKGRGGDDTICGGDGHDHLYGGAGDDRLEGGRGDWDNVLLGGAGADTYIEGRVSFEDAAGPITLEGRWTTEGDLLVDIDLIFGSPYGDHLETAGSWGVRVFGGDGDDTIVVANDPKGESWAGGEAGDDTIVGSPAGYSFIEGDEGDDTLTARGGTNEIVGGTGADTMTGARGDDYFEVVDGDVARGRGGDDEFSMYRGPARVGDDSVRGGRGRDRVTYGGNDRHPNGVVVDLAAGTATGFGIDTVRGIEDVFGTTQPDVIRGSRRANRLLGAEYHGRKDADVLVGRGGADTLNGKSGSDRADGGGGEDTCYAEVENRCEE